MHYWTVLFVVIPLISKAEANKTIAKECPDPNELYSAFGGCCQPTCSHPEIQETGNCKKGCICFNGTVRDKFSGTCIKKENCCFNMYEVYQECGSSCEPTCEGQIRNQCLDVCKAGCFCSYGTIREMATGKCVNISDCTCQSKDEVFKECGTDCPPTCSKSPMFCNMMCRSGCFCKEGMVRDETTNKCVTVKDCTCPTEDEVFEECGTFCPATCRNPYTEVCPDVCVRGCFCKDKKKVRDGYTGKCVDIQKCTCGEKDNEVFSTCGSACQPNCTHPKPPISCTKQCVIGCFCKKGTVRNTDTGRCVPVEDCYCDLESRCKKNHVFRYEPTWERSCSSPNIKKEVEHSNNCYCKQSYYRNEKTGECVKLKNCCNHGHHEVYDLCVSVGGVCENTCSSPNKNVQCKAPCAPGCKCREGFLRDDITRECIPKAKCPK